MLSIPHTMGPIFYCSRAISLRACWYFRSLIPARGGFKKFTRAWSTRVRISSARQAPISATLPGLPVLNNLSARAGVRFSGVDISAYANNLTNAHPLMFESRDIAPYALGPGTNGGTGPTTDSLYFARGAPREPALGRGCVARVATPARSRRPPAAEWCASPATWRRLSTPPPARRALPANPNPPRC